MHVRLSVVGSGHSELPRFQRALDHAGVMTVSGPGPQTSCPALIYFIDAPPELAARACALSAGGAGRVLAVAGPGAAPMSNLAWDLLDAGASDVISWDSCADPIQAIITRLERWRKVGRAHRFGGSPRQSCGHGRALDGASAPDRGGGAVHPRAGSHHRRKRHRERAGGASHSSARWPPRKKELTVLDCATVVPGLSGSEFFGHEKGAFTGAAGPRDGAFALADGGTLFLDEVGELPPNLQAELLRVIQEGTYKRVGSNTWRTTSFRLVSATNRDLVQEQQADSGLTCTTASLRGSSGCRRCMSGVRTSNRSRDTSFRGPAQVRRRSSSNLRCVRSYSPASTRATSGICVNWLSG